MPSENLDQERPLRKFPTKNKKETPMIAIATLIVVSLGILSGYMLSGKSIASNEQSAPGATEVNGGVGIADESTFSDSATGVIQAGGIAGEGTHHLEREGGESQNVYLTSTVIDLESFVGKKVTVWGQTISAKQAGWLMDVGKVKAEN